MSENEKNNPFLTATYQNIFIMDLRQVNECFFHRDYEGSFEALKILYSDMLEKPREDAKKDWEKFLAGKQAILSSGELSFRRTANYEKAKIKYLYENIPKIKAKFIKVLENNNLLNLELGAKPKYPHKRAAKL